MTTIAARLFGAGAPATGAPAEVSFFGDQIHVRSGELAVSARVSELRIREVGFGRQMGYELAWDDTRGIYAVHVMDAIAVKALLASQSIGACAQLQSLQSTQKHRALGRGIGWILIAAIVGLPVILVLLFIWQADRIVGALVDRVPVGEEIKIGRDAFAEMRTSLTLEDSGPAFNAVSDLGKQLSQDSKYAFEFHVVRDKTINAFALPGGIVVVNSGLIAATRRPEELAGVLAHEIQHVEQRHSLRGAIKQLGLRGAWALVTGDWGSSVWGQAALQLTSLQFSRQDESSADSKGFESLVHHNIDPRGMIDFFATMQQQDTANPPAFLSTHPADSERVGLLDAKIKALAQRNYPPLQMGEWPPATN